ncbi:hypothetical protein ACFZBU_39215 [Embleya sp. NPDC008237]|uniref:hypothetical protein n=1 Tax=Embleya sp. NPDC008237 TaxID=3363978 RepID=UPI0036F14B19
MNTLPAPYRWSSGPADALAHSHAGHVPVIRPAETDRADRMRRVLAWYATDPRAPRPAAPAGARIASVGPHRTLGDLAATVLGRPHHHAAGLDELPDDLAGGSVLVIAPAEHLTLAALVPYLTRQAARDTTVGFLTGRDVAAITFALAKTHAAHTAHTHAASALIDGTTGLSRLLPAPGQGIATPDALARSWRTLIVDAHGSAAHAALGPAILCGLTGTREHTTTGTEIPDGCTRRHCKTDTTGGRIPTLAPHDLKTEILALFVCNAIALGATEQYPSDVNLALDAVEGHPAAVLGLLRGDLNTTDTEPQAAATLLHAGHTLGHCVRALDHDGAARGIHGPSTVLLGDPELRPHRTGAPPDMRLRRLPSPSPSPPCEPALQLAVLSEAAAFEHALRASLRIRPDAELAACLDRLRAHHTAAVDHLLDTSSASTDLHEPRDIARAWAETALSISATTSGGAYARQVAAAHAHHRVQHLTPTDPCPYCRAPRHREHHTSRLGHSPRTAIHCPRCGPALSEPADAPACTVDVPRALHPGAPVLVRVSIATAGTGTDIPCAVHLRPRTTRAGSHDHAFANIAPGTPHTFTLAMPARPIPELDRIWVIHADGFRLSFRQFRVPSLPTDEKLAPPHGT